jgi:TatD DNase family protein
MEFIDTHAHLYDEAFDKDRDEVINRYREAGGTELICVAFDMDSIPRAIALAEKYWFIYASVGVHPHDAGDVPPDYLDLLADFARHPKVVALGEMGLDYYRDLSPREIQRNVFVEQLNLAKESGKPIIIHDRDAHGDLLDILRREGVGDAGGVMHCFSGSWEMARECMEMGLYISLAGPVTFKNARKAKEVAVNVPLDRLLIETDCPYLAPEPRRGMRNEPAYVKYVAACIAELRGITPSELAAVAGANAKRLFNLN